MIDGPEMISFATGAGGSSALLFYFFRRWVDRMDDRLDQLTKMLAQIELVLARKDGESIGQNKLIWAEIEKLKESIHDLSLRMQKNSDQIMLIGRDDKR